MNEKARDFGLLVLRLSGLLLLGYHGWGKITSLATGGGERFVQGVAEMGFPAPLVFAWAAALSESVGALLLAAGLFTRVAAAGAAITVAVAAFARHHALDQALNALGIRAVSAEQLKEWGKPELALVFLLVFAGILLLGPGRYALDNYLGRGRGRSSGARASKAR